nr:transposase domain-containing protein [uncultured Macellibacteroides sp.]
MKRISLIYKINTVKKLVYYLYEEGSRARKVIGNFLSGFLLQSHQVASNGAYMYTLVESCKMSGTSPVAYIKDVLCSLIKGRNRLFTADTL